MNISQYETIVKTLEAGTITKAAEELGYTQSGLTRALNTLEEEWGIRLLARGRSGVKLTAEGILLMPHIRKILVEQRKLAEHINEIQGLSDGVIRIGTFNSCSAQWLPGIIRRYHDDYPGIKFELLHGTDAQVTRWIAEERVDIGFVEYPTREDIDAEFLYRDQIVGIFAADDPLAAEGKFDIRKLPDLPYIALNEGVDDEITAILAKNNINPNTRFIEEDDHAVIAMVESGLGTSLMSNMMIQGFDRRITAVPLDPPAYRELGIACKSRGVLSAAAAIFYQYACDWVRNEYKG